MPRRGAARDLATVMPGGRQGKAPADDQEEHEESHDLDEQLDGPVGSNLRRTSARKSPGGGKGASSTDGRSGVAHLSEVIGLVANLFRGVQAKELAFYNVEGRGSCAPLALAASTGLAIPHAGVAADSTASKIGKVTSAERYIDITLRLGAYQIILDHFEGRRLSSKQTMKAFASDRMHSMLMSTTSKQEGEWVSLEIVQVMAAYMGLRFLYVINTDLKIILVTKIDYSGDNDEDLTKFYSESFSWEEWKGEKVMSSKKNTFKAHHDTIQKTGSDLDRTFSVLLTSGLSNVDMHYVAIRPREDNKVPFRRFLDSNIRGRTLLEELAKEREETEIGKLIGKHMHVVRQKLKEEPEKTWQEVVLLLVDGDDDDDDDDNDDDDDDEAKKKPAAAAKKKPATAAAAVAANNKRAKTNDDDDDDDDDEAK